MFPKGKTTPLKATIIRTADCTPPPPVQIPPLELLPNTSRDCSRKFETTERDFYSPRMAEDSPKIQKCLSETFVQNEREEKQEKEEKAWQKEEWRSEKEEEREEERRKTDRGKEEERREEEEMRVEAKDRIRERRQDEIRKKGSLTTMTGKRRKSRVVSCTINMTLDGIDSCKRNLNELEVMKEERESSNFKF